MLLYIENYTWEKVSENKIASLKKDIKLTTSLRVNNAAACLTQPKRKKIFQPKNNFFYLPKGNLFSKGENCLYMPKKYYFLNENVSYICSKKADFPNKNSFF